MIDREKETNIDIQNISNWQKNKDMESFTALMSRFNPVITSHVNKFKTSGVNASSLRAEATTNVVKAFDSYDPSKETAPITHVFNGLKRLQRSANNSLTSGHIPEARRLQMATFKTAVDNLHDNLGREANVDEISDELGWNKREVERMNQEVSGETNASNAEFDFFGNSTTGTSRDRELADYLYLELDGVEKVVFEHSFGYGGKEILNNKGIAKAIDKNEVYIGRVKKKLTNRLKEFK